MGGLCAGAPGGGYAVRQVVAVAAEAAGGSFAVPALVVDLFSDGEGVAVGLSVGADLDGGRSAAIRLRDRRLDPYSLAASAAETVTEGDALAAVDGVGAGEEEAGQTTDEAFG